MKKSKIITICTLNIAFVIFLSGCAQRFIEYDYLNKSIVDEENISGRITSSGSTSMTKLLNSLGESFQEEYPGLSIEKSDTGSGAAITSVLDGSCMLGDISRYLKESEEPWKFNQEVIALDGIAIILNKSNTINNLSSEQIKDIFTGKISYWSEIGGLDLPITLIGREEASGTREGFEQIFNLNKSKVLYDAEFPEAGDVLSKVGVDESCVGYISISSVSGNVKAINIDGISPTEENIVNKTYVVQRPFIQIYLKNNTESVLKKWFEFVFSEKGKKIIKKEKFIPVS